MCHCKLGNSENIAKYILSKQKVPHFLDFAVEKSHPRAKTKPAISI